MEAVKLFFSLVGLLLTFTKYAESRTRLHYVPHGHNMAVQNLFSRFVGSISDKCLTCICMVESRCQAVGCVSVNGTQTCGFYHIKLQYWKDCGSPGGDWMTCAKNYTCATTCVRNYMARYGPVSGCPDTCETYARIHIGGPRGCKNPETIPYWHRVQSYGC
ncbi:hypothetical protein CHS0354_038621 [Potamilus streckersoni]|uniref:lysozyme n=1 Tax=Potamilus streckersoni TaxID=2493646 RepID=A0AAE0TGM6_9BIVA|nr:hypothetical protein CHS0354_038621 [Potamilus streckersoni]